MKIATESAATRWLDAYFESPEGKETIARHWRLHAPPERMATSADAERIMLPFLLTIVARLDVK
jgi:hypothetical protein